MIDWVISCALGKFKKSFPRRSKKEYDLSLFDDLCWVADHKDMENPEISYSYKDITHDIYERAIAAPMENIDDKNDCADFKALKLLHLSFETREFLSRNSAIFKKIEKCITGFNFWITDSRNDSMCYYSENHQITFAVVEYMAGLLFPEACFLCDLKSGKEHVERAKQRIEIWFSLRKEFGFSEFMSSNYLPIDVAALSALVIHGDAGLKKSAAEALDMLMECYAFGFFKHTFINASGRDYPGNLAGTPNRSMNSFIITTTAFIDPTAFVFERGKAATLFVKAVSEGYYSVPDKTVKNAFANVDEIRHFGLDTKDYKKHGLLKCDTRSMMMQLGSGALTNRHIINQTYKMIVKNKLWHHDFLHWLRFLDSPLYRHLGLMPLFSRLFNYFQNGMSLESADIHMIRTPHYKISVLENYFPGSFGAQKNTLAITLDNKTSFFINHPLRDWKGPDDYPFDEVGAPTYFGGYNTAPAATAIKDTVMMIYRLPLVRGYFAPCKVIPYTHAYFDTSRYDETEFDGNYVFAKAGASFIAIIGKNELISESPDLIQRGRNVFWITVLSDSEKETFDRFKERIKEIPLSFDGKRLVFGDRKLTYVRKRL